MLLFILVAAAIVAGSYFYYLNWFRPKKILRWYKETLEALGYNVVTLPFMPLKITLGECQKHNQKEFKDAFYDQKHKWHNYEIVLSNTGNIPTLILLKPRLLQSFFSPDKQPLFYKSLTNKVAFNLTLRDSLIFNEDQKWKRKRRIFTDILNFEFIKAKIPKMVNICQNTLTFIESTHHSQQQNKEEYCVSLASHFKDMIAEIVIKLFFGCEAKELTIDGASLSTYLSNILAEARNQSSDWLVLLFGEKVYEWGVRQNYRNLYKRISLLRSTVRDLLLRKMKGIPEQMDSYHDLFEALFFLKQKSKGEQNTIEMEEFISQFCAFLTASNDTTGNYINMITYYLSQNEEFMHKLQKNIRDKFKKTSEISYYQLRDIHLLDCCLFQTTRMYGPASSILLRQAKSDTYIDNIPLLKGTGVKIEMLASHYNPKIYKDPFKFDPARWNITGPENHPFSFGGFGSGAHSCIGKQLALLSSKVIVSVLLLRYDEIQIKEADKIEMVCRGLYQPTAFKTTLIKAQNRQEQRDKVGERDEIHRMIEME